MREVGRYLTQDFDVDPQYSRGADSGAFEHTKAQGEGCGKEAC